MLLTGPAVIKLEDGIEYKCIITSFIQECTRGLNTHLITTKAEVTITQILEESTKHD